MAGKLSLAAKGFGVQVRERGDLTVSVGADRYTIESAFSHPGVRIGWNRFTAREAAGAWRPAMAKQRPDTIEVCAAGKHYSVRRQVRLRGGRIEVSDKITNTVRSPLAVIVRHSLRRPDGVGAPLLCGAVEAATRVGSAENPTLFLDGPGGGLGVVAEDSVFRLQFAARSAGRSTAFGVRHFSLAPGRSHTFEWVLYPLPGERDYFAFINRLRRDWDANFPVPGPWVAFDVTEPEFVRLMKDPVRLKEFFQRSGAKVFRPNPWLDYTHLNSQTDRFMTRPEYKQVMQEALATVRKAAPGILCVGSIEGDIVTLPEECSNRIYALQPKNKRGYGYYFFSRRQTEVLNEYDLPWKDCMAKNRQGQGRFELYYHQRNPGLAALTVYAAPGNGQHKYLKDQVKYLIEEVGFDGVYVDQFSLAFGEAPASRFGRSTWFSDPLRFTHERWDGLTVDIDPRTGRIARKYTDCALVSIGARLDVVKDALARGKLMIVNQHAASRELQACRIGRLVEGESRLREYVRHAKVGVEPPLQVRLCRGQLDSPIGAGLRPQQFGDWGRRNYWTAITKAMIAHLRHGMLYNHCTTTELPDLATGDYGPIRHMYPITPVSLHEGWIEGKERIITCVSGAYAWPHPRRPKTFLFDIKGREAPHSFAVTRSGKGWRVKVDIGDWRQIAVLEQ